MTDYSALLQPDRGQAARTIHLVAKAGCEAWLAAQPERVRALAAAQRFAAKPGEVLIVPEDTADGWSIVAGAADTPGTWDLAGISTKLPAGTYRLGEGEPGAGALGWLLSHYQFDRYRAKADTVPDRVLLTTNPGAIAETVRLAQATALVRDMVNTPAADMGPEAMEQLVRSVAKAHHATVHVTKGDALETGYPMIHAVGRAADKMHAPRLIELEWGKPDHPRIAIVGKGVAFDSGGLDIKPPSAMRLMKKDMGGAAHALALAQLVMQAGLPVRLHLLIPAVENAISGNAFRPGDILASRAGLTIEIDNTDAEGRLILGDALTKAGEDGAGLIVDFATLTGAARSALGPDLPALFVNDEPLAAAFNAAAADVHDPLWRMPLWPRYDDMLKSEVADLANSSDSPMAGAITGALFLQRFVKEGTPWAHFDTFAWRPAPAPGRPKGGEALGLRASWEVLKCRFGG